MTFLNMVAWCTWLVGIETHTHVVMVWSWSILVDAFDEILLDLVMDVYTHDGMMDLGMYIDGSLDPLMKSFLKLFIVF